MCPKVSWGPAEFAGIIFFFGGGLSRCLKTVKRLVQQSLGLLLKLFFCFWIVKIASPLKFEPIFQKKRKEKNSVINALSKLYMM